MHNPIVSVTAIGPVTTVDLRRPLSQLPAEVVLPVPSPGLISKITIEKELVRRGLVSPSQDSEDLQAANRTDSGTPPESNAEITGLSG